MVVPFTRARFLALLLAAMTAVVNLRRSHVAVKRQGSRPWPSGHVEPGNATPVSSAQASASKNAAAKENEQPRTPLSEKNRGSKAASSVADGTEKCLRTCCVKTTMNPPRHSSSGALFPGVKDRIGASEVMTTLPEVFYRAKPKKKAKAERREAKRFCNGTVQELSGKTLARWSYVALTERLAPCLQAGTVILVQMANVAAFFAEMHPLLRAPYVLLSFNGDASAPGAHVGRLGPH